MNRRELLLLLGGAMTVSSGLRAEQKAMPVIGFLAGASPGAFPPFVAGFYQGLSEAGCVASYGTRLLEGWAMLAVLTDKMLKGARPGETPAQQPTRFELVINRKVAGAIGIEIPQLLLARADEVIE